MNRDVSYISNVEAIKKGRQIESRKEERLFAASKGQEAPGRWLAISCCFEASNLRSYFRFSKGHSIAEFSSSDKYNIRPGSLKTFLEHQTPKET